MMQTAMSDDQPSEVLSALPRRRPQRRSQKRPGATRRTTGPVSEPAARATSTPMSPAPVATTAPAQVGPGQVTTTTPGEGRSGPVAAAAPAPVAPNPVAPTTQAPADPTPVATAAPSPAAPGSVAGQTPADGPDLSSASRPIRDRLAGTIPQPDFVAAIPQSGPIDATTPTPHADRTATTTLRSATRAGSTGRDRSTTPNGRSAIPSADPAAAGPGPAQPEPGAPKTVELPHPRPLRQPAQPDGLPTTPRKPPPEPTGGVDIFETAVHAAAELAEIGLTISARAIRRAVERLPRP